VDSGRTGDAQTGCTSQLRRSRRFDRKDNWDPAEKNSISMLVRPQMALSLVAPLPLRVGAYAAAKDRSIDFEICILRCLQNWDND
jgi:hypothetical protein